MSEIDILRKEPLSAYIGEVIYEPGGTYGPRVQKDIQLVLIHKGEADIRIKGDWHHVGSQEVCLLRPGHSEFFQFSKHTQTHHSWSAIHYPQSAKVIQNALKSFPFKLPLSPRMQSLMELGLSIQPREAGSLMPLIRKVAAVIVQEFISEALNSMEQAHQSMPESVNRVRHYIQKHYAESLSLPDLARIGCMTPPHLIRIFRRYLNTTPMRYLWETRIRHGTELLMNTGLAISEIAYRTGFQSPFHFSRLVKQFHKKSPKQFREDRWNAAISGKPAKPGSAR